MPDKNKMRIELLDILHRIRCMRLFTVLQKIITDTEPSSYFKVTAGAR